MRREPGEREHRTVRCECGSQVSTAALTCQACDRVVHAESFVPARSLAPRPVSAPVSTTGPSVDEIEEMRARGFEWSVIELEAIRRGWFDNAGDARRYLQRLQANEVTRRRRRRRAVWREVSFQFIGVIIGLAIVAGFFMIDGARDNEYAAAFALSGAGLVAGCAQKLVRFYLARGDEDELLELTDVVRTPPWRPKPDDDGLSEVQKDQIERQGRALKDAQDSGVRPV